jgi:hypothetical protein
MKSWKYAVFMTLLYGLIMGTWAALWPVGSPAAPRSFEEVMAIAQKLGLHCLRDPDNVNTGGRLILSDLPLTWENAACMCVCRPLDHPDWKGRVAVYRQGASPLELEEGFSWGPSLVVHGDRSVIDILVAQRKTKTGGP